MLLHLAGQQLQLFDGIYKESCAGLNAKLASIVNR